MIKFKVLVVKAKANDIHIIFLFKKNIRSNIKMILGYLPIIASTSLKKWKIAITSVRQRYESTKRR